MALCRVTGTVYLPNGSLAGNRQIVFRREKKDITAEYLGALFPDDVWQFTNAQGQIDVTLLTGRYVAFAQAPQRAYFGIVTVPDAATANFADIIGDFEIPDTPPVWYNQALAARDEAVDAADEAADSAAAADAEAAAAAEDRVQTGQDREQTGADRAAAAASADLAEQAAAAIQGYPDRATAVAASKIPGQLQFEVIAPNGSILRYVENATASTPALTMADGTKLIPAGYATPAHFGPFTAANSNSVIAQENAETLQKAYDYVKSKGLALEYPQGEVIYLLDHDANGYAVHFDGDNVTHIGNGCTLKNADPSTSLVYGAPSALTVSGNGRKHTTGGKFKELKFDNGLQVQLCGNPSGEDGTATGWDAVGSATMSSQVANDFGRYLRAQVSAAGGGAHYAIQTTPGENYWLTITVLEASEHFYLSPSTTTGLSGGIVPIGGSASSIGLNRVFIAADALYDPLGRVTIQFTATTSTTYILLRTNGSASSDAVLRFRDVYAFEQRGEADHPPMMVMPGMQHTTFDRCEFRNSGHYLVALQNGGHIGNRFTKCIFADCYMDGLDAKNNGNISRDNVVEGCTFLRNSLKETAANPSAALDLAQGWEVSNIYLEQLACNAGAGSALRFKTGIVGESSGRGTGGKDNMASNVRVKVLAVPNPGYAAFAAQHDDEIVRGIVATGVDIGAKISGSRAVLSGFIFENVRIGVDLDDYTFSTGQVASADGLSISDGSILASESSLLLGGGRVTATSVHMDAQDGTDIIVNDGSVTVLGGSSSASTSHAINAGTLKTYGMDGIATDLA